MAISIEELLYEEESSTLDFKSEQYPFSGAEDYQKSELLKDILAFANAWRREEAIILIGVKERKGTRAEPVGINSSLDDAALQEFINSKVNRPITFSYSEVTYDGVALGLLRIPAQERPFFLKAKFNKLQKGAVYLRRGSSTAIADPDEVFRMGLSSIELKVEQPQLDFQFANIQDKSSIGSDLSIETTFLKTPEIARIPDYRGDHGFETMLNKRFYRELTSYYFFKNIVAPIGFSIKNTSSFLIEGVEIVIEFQNGVIAYEVSDYPTLPKKRLDISSPLLNATRPTIFHNALSENNVEVRTVSDRIEVVASFRKIKPQQTVFSSDEIFVAAGESGVFPLTTTIYADNLPKPIKVDMSISATVHQQNARLEDVLQIHERQS